MKPSLLMLRLLAIVFFALISYGLTGSIAVKSWTGTILAIVSLGATIIFLYLLPKLYNNPNDEESSAR
ncbi:MAG TPA: hypothetical protein VK588_10560 [Chitinophagaceae bacterium]|nr:hypothetical protein [Chitinophagaceae bacterium]